MRASDFIEPLPLSDPRRSLRSVLPWLSAGCPVALPDAGGWRVVEPADVLAMPATRQLCDLPSRTLDTLPVDQELDLATLAERDRWGVTASNTLVGRIDSLRVLGSIGKLAGPGDIASATRDRLMPRFLHNLSNTLQMAALAEQLDAGEAPRVATMAALDHARALADAIRLLYGDQRIQSRESFTVDTVVRRIESMLGLAAAPARLQVHCAEGLTIAGQPWRLECLVLNLVLNASEIAKHIDVTAQAGDGHVELLVVDDGPGLSDATLALGAVPEHATLHGHGIASVRRQAALLGGRLVYKASAGGGTIAEIRFPIPHEP